MANDAYALAEKRGYSKGYTAGRRRVAREDQAARRRVRESAFWLRAYLQALPTALTVENWKFGDKRITTSEQRTELVACWADRSLTIARLRGHL